MILENQGNNWALGLVISATKSNQRYVDNGIPQGSILEPVSSLRHSLREWSRAYLSKLTENWIKINYLKFNKSCIWRVKTHGIRTH